MSSIHSRRETNTAARCIRTLRFSSFICFSWGWHPFAGIFRQGKADKTIEDAIREFRFAYLPDHEATEMESPPFVPTLSDFHLTSHNSSYVLLVRSAQKEIVRAGTTG